MHAQTPLNDSRPVLVIGSTGKTGRRIAARLRDRGFPVREGSRSAPIPFDWDDRSTWAPALEGVRAAYIAFVPDLAVPGAAEAVDGLTRMAAEAGVEKLVLLSGRGEPEARRSERIVESAGPAWTVVRASWFMQNFSEAFLLDMVHGGTVALPVSDVREPFIDVDDIADVAVDALTGSRLDGQVVEVTGPRAMTFAEAVAEIADAVDHELRFVTIPHEEFLSASLRAGVPGSYVQLLDELFRVVLDGRNEATTDGVERALGRPARGFGDYVARTAAAGAWAQEVAR